MSIAGYVSRPGPERVTKGEQIRELLEQKKPVTKNELKTQVYEAMQDYDPVLRSHCRLGMQEAGTPPVNISGARHSARQAVLKETS